MLSVPSFSLLCFQLPVDLYPSSRRHLHLERCPCGAGYPLWLPDGALQRRATSPSTRFFIDPLRSSYSKTNLGNSFPCRTQSKITKLSDFLQDWDMRNSSEKVQKDRSQAAERSSFPMNSPRALQRLLSQRKNRARVPRALHLPTPTPSGRTRFFISGGQKEQVLDSQCSWRTHQQYTYSAEEGVLIKTQARRSH